jgi:ribosomal protein S18 acetylase RimI-like enzyme
MYSNNFYEKVVSGERYSKLAFFKDMLIAAISTKTDHKEDGSVEVYLMTITVLKPYRRYGIASQCLAQAIQDCVDSKEVDRMVLHV